MNTFYCSNRDCDRRWANFRSRAASPRCRSCKSPARPLVPIKTGRWLGLKHAPDWPEHFNHSVGEVVKSRQHYRELMRKNNLKEWEPVAGGSTQAERARRHVEQQREKMRHDMWRHL